MLWIILGVFIGVVSLSVVSTLGLLPRRVQQWCCQYLEWHRVDVKHFNGNQWTGCCHHCGARVLRDNQGNWSTVKCLKAKELRNRE